MLESWSCRWQHYLNRFLNSENNVGCAGFVTVNVSGLLRSQSRTSF
jgi:hypothetical protein